MNGHLPNLKRRIIPSHIIRLLLLLIPLLVIHRRVHGIHLPGGVDGFFAGLFATAGVEEGGAGAGVIPPTPHRNHIRLQRRTMLQRLLRNNTLHVHVHLVSYVGHCLAIVLSLMLHSSHLCHWQLSLAVLSLAVLG